MAEVRSLVCDMCGAADATGWQAGKRGNAEWHIDLCDTCAAPLVAMAGKSRPPAGKKRQYRKYGEKVKVLE